MIRAYREAECANTNIEAVFDLLLTTAKQAGMKQEDIPEVLIISDMEFDSCVETNAHRGWSPNICQSEPNLFKAIGAKWKAAGYDLQRITHTALKILLRHSKGGHQYKNNKYKWKSFHNRAKITNFFVYLPSEESNTLP